VDDATLSRLELERKIESLMDEIEFLKKLHEEVGGQGCQGKLGSGLAGTMETKLWRRLVGEAGMRCECVFFFFCFSLDLATHPLYRWFDFHPCAICWRSGELHQEPDSWLRSSLGAGCTVQCGPCPPWRPLPLMQVFVFSFPYANCAPRVGFALSAHPGP
jgi:hypothetical protein